MLDTFKDSTINPEPEYTRGFQLSDADAAVRLEPHLPWHVWQTILKMREIQAQSPVWFSAEFGGDLNYLENLYQKLEGIWGE